MAQVVREAYENLILELYPESSLPFCWQVIYQEGMRNHHFLFTKEDLGNFNQSSGSRQHEVIRDAGEDLIEVFAKMMTMGVYSDIQTLLSQQSVLVREGIYCLYLRVLRNWQIAQKLSLH